MFRSGISGNHAQLAADLGERTDGVIEVMAFVEGGELYPDAGLSFGHHRIVEADHIDTFFQQPLGETLGQGRIVQHEGTMGCSPGLMSKPAAVICSRK